MMLLLAQAAAGLSVGQYIFSAIYVLICIMLVVAILSRTTKDEGISGSMMGGSDTSSFRGAKSTEDTVDQITNVIAVVFIVLSIVANYVLR